VKIVVSTNGIGLIIAQTLSGQVIKKVIPLYLTLQLMFFVLVEYLTPINVNTIYEALEDTLKLGMIKRLILSKFEESPTVKYLSESFD
jgi:hypothetical protein